MGAESCGVAAKVVVAASMETMEVTMATGIRSVLMIVSFLKSSGGDLVRPSRNGKATEVPAFPEAGSLHTRP